MENFKKQALADINAVVHKRGTIKILEEGKYYYEFLILGLQVNDYETIIKVVELSDTEFNEDNKVYRFSLEELIEARAYYLEKTEKNLQKYKKIFVNINVC